MSNEAIEKLLNACEKFPFCVFTVNTSDCFSFRLDQFKALLSEPVIDINRLRKMCFDGKMCHLGFCFKFMLFIPGCPDAPGIRATCWKVCTINNFH